MTQFKKCKVVLLPTEKAIKNQIFQYKEEVKFPYVAKIGQFSYAGFNFDSKMDGFKHLQPYHLYILSDEEIKVGDWAYNTFNGIICQNKTNHIWTKVNDPLTLKVIATTDEDLGYGDGTGYFEHLPHPSHKFIKKFCELNGIYEILVEYYSDDFGEKYTSNELGIDWLSGVDVSGQLKVAPDNTITIKRIKENYTLEEVKKIVEYTKSLNYMDGSKPQHEFTTMEIIDKCFLINI